MTRSSAGFLARIRSHTTPAGWLLAAIGALLVIAPALREIDRSLLAAQPGYTRIVDWLAQSGALTIASGNSGSGDRVVPGPVAPPGLTRFAALSFLHDDMQTLDADIWRTSDSNLRLIGLEPSAHMVGRILESPERWTGKIIYADGSAPPQLVLVDRALAKRAVLGPRRSDAEHYSFGAAINLFGPPSPAGHPVHRAALRYHDTDMAVVHAIGNGAALQLSPAARALGVTVSIGPLPLSPTSNGSNTWYPLNERDIIQLHTPQGTASFRLMRSHRTISEMSPGGRRLRAAGLESLARQIEQVAARARPQIETSIDAGVQEDAQQLLGEAGRRLARYSRNSFRAGAVLLDGLSGEIVALPTFPAQSRDLAPGRQGKDMAILARNSNFLTLPIGSTAKPPLALTIAAAFDRSAQGSGQNRLVDLVVPGGDGYDTLLGIKLGARGSDHVKGLIDFRSFLARSSNKYAAMVMMLGLSIDGRLPCATSGSRTLPPDQVYGFRTGSGGVRWCTHVPQLRIAQAPAGNMLVGQGFADELDARFCIGSNMAAPDCAIRLLRDDSLDRRNSALTGLLPEQEAFGFASVNNRELFSDYVMTILGGNRSRWTTIRLAQTYARMLTDQKVNARLQPRSDYEARREAESVGLYPPARAAVMSGLRAVLAPGGTGAGCCGRLDTQPMPNGETLRLFAKTGTANIDYSIEDDSPGGQDRRILRAFVARRCGLQRIAGRGNHIILGFPGQTMSNEAAMAAWIDQRAPSGCAVFHGAPARAVARAVARLNRRSLSSGAQEAFAGIRFGQGGVLEGIASKPALGQGYGHAMVLLVGRYQPHAPDHRPCALSVIAANFQRRYPKGQAGVPIERAFNAPALAYVDTLARAPQVRAWLTRPCR